MIGKYKTKANTEMFILEEKVGTSGIEYLVRTQMGKEWWQTESYLKKMISNGTITKI